jgi:hypothetical protein
MTGCQHDHTGPHILGLLAPAGDALLWNAVETAVEHATEKVRPDCADRVHNVLMDRIGNTYSKDGLVYLDSDDYEDLRTVLADGARHMHARAYDLDETYPEDCWAARVLGPNAAPALRCYTRTMNTQGKGAVLRRLAADTANMPNTLPWPVLA